MFSFFQSPVMIIAGLIYIIPLILIVYWMVKMLKNSNENNKINREILERLKTEKESNPKLE